MDQSRTLDMQLEQVLGQLAQRDAKAQPWHEALVKLNSFDVNGAATIAAKTIGNGLDQNLVESALATISRAAVRKRLQGPGIEAMTMKAADTGFHDMAFNAGNYAYDRATKPADFRLAEKYYLQAYEKSETDSVRAAAICNCAAIIREGEITGQKDWPAAVELYEKAAALDLLAGAFNAGNVSMWLANTEHKSYAERAAKWFELVIDVVKHGKSSVDLGGDEERATLLQNSSMALAELHARGQVPNASLVACQSLIAPYVGTEPRALWCLNLATETWMGKVLARPSPTAGGNWRTVLEMMGWTIQTTTSFDYGDARGVPTKGELLLIDAAPGKTMTLIVMDTFVHPGTESFSVMVDLACAHFEELGHACHIVGSKAFFTDISGYAYSVIFRMEGDQFSTVPIWPGATCADVLAIGEKPEVERFVENTIDANNTIPRFVNALDESIELKGDGCPPAIWVGAGQNLRLSIMSSKEPNRVGLQIPYSEAELEVHFAKLSKARFDDQ
jgi:hypothetical protein